MVGETAILGEHGHNSTMQDPTVVPEGTNEIELDENLNLGALVAVGVPPIMGTEEKVDEKMGQGTFDGSGGGEAK